MIVIVKVPLTETWPCERCDDADVIAYISVDDNDETTGYCADCICGAVKAELS